MLILGWFNSWSEDRPQSPQPSPKPPKIYHSYHATKPILKLLLTMDLLDLSKLPPKKDISGHFGDGPEIG